jgi:hypothetical protein
MSHISFVISPFEFSRNKYLISNGNLWRYWPAVSAVNIIALGLANLIGGLFIIGHNVSKLGSPCWQ